MPRPLRNPVPTSAVARLLDRNAAARAVADAVPSTRPLPLAAEIPAPQAPAPVSLLQAEPATVHRELVLTASADATFERLVDLYRRATGTKLSASHVARALLKAVAQAMPYLEDQAKNLPPLKLPGNAKGREPDRERFELLLARAFLAGMRDAPVFGRPGSE